MKIHKTSSETALSNQKENQMNQIRLHVWGDYACFTRPEMKVERVSYDVITPSAARGILAAILSGCPSDTDSDVNR